MPFLPVSYEYQEFWSFQVVCWHSMTDVSATWAVGHSVCATHWLRIQGKLAGGEAFAPVQNMSGSAFQSSTHRMLQMAVTQLVFLPKCVAIYRLVTCFIGAWCCISFEARSLIHWWHTHCLTISLQKNHYILLYVGDTLVQFKRFFFSL